MPGSSALLRKLASSGRFTNKFGMTCHAAVLEWIAGAGYLDARSVDWLRTHNPAAGWYASAMVQENAANRIQNNDELRNLRRSEGVVIIGFRNAAAAVGGDGGLKHSMVLTKVGWPSGRAYLAGANNAGVLRHSEASQRYAYGRRGAAEFSDDHLDWRGTVVGDNQCSVYWERPENLGATDIFAHV